MYHSYPAAYRHISNCNILVLPHPTYLSKLSVNPEMLNSGITNNHLKYLAMKLKSLNEDERHINLLMDEIHMKSILNHKAGKLQGITENNSNPATSLQAFMLTSVKSNNKDIVALYPVSKLTANNLVHYINLVLKSLHTLGYKCVSVISDNNRVNRKAFEIMCGGTLTSPIQHPSDPNSK